MRRSYNEKHNFNIIYVWQTYWTVSRTCGIFFFRLFLFGSRPLPDGYTDTRAGTAGFSQLFKTTKSHVILSPYHTSYMEIG